MQALLRVGIVRSKRAPTKTHPYGYMKDKFVWSLVSAVGIFCLGAGVTCAHGVSSLMAPPVQLEHLGYGLAGALLPALHTPARLPGVSPCIAGAPGLRPRRCAPLGPPHVAVTPHARLPDVSPCIAGAPGLQPCRCPCARSPHIAVMPHERLQECPAWCELVHRLSTRGSDASVGHLAYSALVCTPAQLGQLGYSFSQMLLIIAAHTASPGL